MGIFNKKQQSEARKDYVITDSFNNETSILLYGEIGDGEDNIACGDFVRDILYFESCLIAFSRRNADNCQM